MQSREKETLIYNTVASYIQEAMTILNKPFLKPLVIKKKASVIHINLLEDMQIVVVYLARGEGRNGLREAHGAPITRAG